MEGWMEGGLVGWLYGQSDGWRDGQTRGWMDRWWMDGWMHRQLDRQMTACVDSQDRWANGQMDE